RLKLQPLTQLNANMTTRGSPPCNSHLQTLQAPGLLHAAPAHEHKRLCTALTPKQIAAASMPSPLTSLSYCRTTLLLALLCPKQLSHTPVVMSETLRNREP